MKQSEKLDLLLKGYYAKKSTYSLYFPDQILKENNIPYTDNREAFQLAKRLSDDGFITAQGISGLRIRGKISSKGIDYVEGDSYTHKGSSIISNYYNTTVSNSSGVSIVNSSDNVNVSISKIIEINKKIEELLQEISSNDAISMEDKVEIQDCIDEIRISLANDKKPKYSFKSLLEMTSDLAGISSLVVEIGKLIF